MMDVTVVRSVCVFAVICQVFEEPMFVCLFKYRIEWSDLAFGEFRVIEKLWRTFLLLFSFFLLQATHVTDWLADNTYTQHLCKFRNFNLFCSLYSVCFRIAEWCVVALKSYQRKWVCVLVLFSAYWNKIIQLHHKTMTSARIHHWLKNTIWKSVQVRRSLIASTHIPAILIIDKQKSVFVFHSTW